MPTKTISRTKNQNLIFERLLKELEEIKDQLGKFLSLIPEESIEEYKNAVQIKKNYLKAVKRFPLR